MKQSRFVPLLYVIFTCCFLFIFSISLSIEWESLNQITTKIIASSSNWNVKDMWNKMIISNTKNNRSSVTRKTQREIELTVRTSGSSKKVLIDELFCMLMRSAVAYWDPAFGAFHLILDENDEDFSRRIKLSLIHISEPTRH